MFYTYFFCVIVFIMETTQNNKKTIPYSGYLVSCSKCGVYAISLISL